MSLTVHLPDLAATEAFGKHLASALFPGAVVALIGPLGAGKTHLVRAVAGGLGIADPRVVNSPTFVLIQEYEARLPIYHFDTYRLPNSGAFRDLGIHEYFASSGVCLVEWADKVADCLPFEYLSIALSITGPTSRSATIEARGPSYQALLDRLRPAVA